MEVYKPGIGIAAGLLMLKWDLIDTKLRDTMMNFKPDDEVNLFINFESVMRNIIQERGLNVTISYFKEKVSLELESSILNLIAHYRGWMKKNKFKPKVYLYYTDLTNTTDQQMVCYNKYYRQFYKNKYKQNPQYRAVGDLLTDVVIPDLKLILSYVDGCYFLTADTFDGSIIPLLVANMSGAKNILISSDVFDTLYLFNPNFLTMYVKRRYKYFSVTCDKDSTIPLLAKTESPFDATIFRNELYYRLLLSVVGSKIRNVKGASGLGINRLMDILQHNESEILHDFSSIESILPFFPEKYREGLKEAYQCMGLDTQYGLLSKTDIENVRSQIVDKIDPSIQTINNRRFLEHPVNLQYLLY